MYLNSKNYRKFIAIVLAISIMAPVNFISGQQTKPKTKVAGVAVGAGVLISGGVIVIILYNTCKKLYKKPKNTNSPPELTLSGNSDDSYAAVECWFEGYCQQENDLTTKSLPASSFLVEGEVSQSGNITNYSLVKEKDLCSLDEFSSIMNFYGVPISVGSHYAKNGQPCDFWETPVTITHGEVPNITVTCNTEVLVTRVIERSYDLINWIPVITNTTPACYKVQFVDISDSPQGFHRTIILP